MIPKIIHYVWCGNNEKPELVKKCIASWKKYCPDYKIVEWNDEKIKKIKNDYMWEAYAAKKWAFVSDYIRIYALKEYGGFYFDTDFELIGDISRFRAHKYVMGFEFWKGKSNSLQTAFIGAEKGSRIVRDIQEEYEKISFLRKDGTYDLTPNPIRIGRILSERYAFKEPFPEDDLVELSDNSVIYPANYFCRPVAGKDNYGIHHFSGSWLPRYSRKEWVKVKNYRLISIKEKNRGSDTEPLPLAGNEKVIFSTQGRIRIMLLKLS